MDIPDLFDPWMDSVREQVPGLELLTPTRTSARTTPT